MQEQKGKSAFVWWIELIL